MKDIWVISDTHFGHSNIIKYCNRPFDNSYFMDETLIENWNSVVKTTDRVYHLGDVYFGKSGERWAEKLYRLNGHKRLILGNHDSGKDPILYKMFESIDMWRARGDLGIVFSHVPLREDSFPGRCVLNVHGHIHNRPSPSKKHFNVSVENINYTPIHIDELVKKI